MSLDPVTMFDLKALFECTSQILELMCTCGLRLSSISTDGKNVRIDPSIYGGHPDEALCTIECFERKSILVSRLCIVDCTPLCCGLIYMTFMAPRSTGRVEDLEEPCKAKRQKRLFGNQRNSKLNPSWRNAGESSYQKARSFYHPKSLL